MPFASVFDTNAYQALSPAKLTEVVAEERRVDILPFADPWVMIELIGKLAHPDTHRHGRAALRKMLDHCGGESPRMVVDCEEQICTLLVGTAPPYHAQTRAAIGRIAQRVAGADRAGSLEDILPVARQLHDHLKRVETERAQMVFESVVRVAVPTADSWDAIARAPAQRTQVVEALDSGAVLRALAASEVRRAHLAVRLPVPDPIPELMIDFLLRHFRYPFELECATIRGVVERGWNLTTAGRRNAVWDAQIAFDAGQTVEGDRTIILVTDDALFHDVAAATSQSGVQRLTQYLHALGVAA